MYKDANGEKEESYNEELKNEESTTFKDDVDIGNVPFECSTAI